MTGPSGSTRQRFFDVALGVSLLGWAAAGVWTGDVAARTAPARLTILVLNVVVGLLLILRAPARRHGSAWAILASLPSLVAAGAALKLAPALGSWPWLSSVLFVVGGCIAVASFLTLSRSFAILPSLRGVVTRGPYGIVRHPAYLGEVAMVAACGLARGGAASVLLPLLAVALVVPRILAEERVLSTSARYREYTERVRRRLLPSVW